MVSKNETTLQLLEPQPVFNLFAQLANIPRPSRKEEKVRQWLKNLASEHEGWVYTQDSIGNVVIRVPASEPRFQSAPVTILQGHIDMVCEANENVQHNFDEDPIQLHVDGDWLKASGTTLGSDNGIGVCISLAIAADKSVKHGPLELLFTIDEEDGMSGAYFLKESAKEKFLTGQYLLNLDTEEDGILYIGCAGSADTTGTFIGKREDLSIEGAKSYRIKISGLLGGHSGVDINKGYANANKILGRVLSRIFDAQIPIGVVNVNGGRKRNAIPREASAVIYLNNEGKSQVESILKDVIANSEFKSIDPNLDINVEPYFTEEKPFTLESSKKITNILKILPSGTIRMSPDIENFVETSTNFGVVTTTGDIVEFANMHRSTNQEALNDVADSFRRLFELANISSITNNELSPWEPQPKSELLTIAKESFKAVRGNEPGVQCIHAALECGLILDALPGCTSISYGPTIIGAHSPSERLRIADVKPCYDVTVDILGRLAEL